MDTDKKVKNNLGNLNVITEGIIGCAFKVANTLGTGFLEKVYENALFLELRKNGFNVEQQKALKVVYDGVIVGDYIGDLVVEDTILVELKAAKKIEDNHVAQCLNYLKATNLKICLLINFGTPKMEVRRLASPFL